MKKEYIIRVSGSETDITELKAESFLRGLVNMTEQWLQKHTADDGFKPVLYAQIDIYKVLADYEKGKV